MAQLAHDLVHEARVVPERVGHVLQVRFGLVVPADAHAVVSNQEMKLEDEFKDLIHRDLQPVVARPAQEALFKNGVQVGVVQANQILEVIYLSELLLEDLPLALDDRNHDILIDRLQEVLHLLPKELKLAELLELGCRDSLCSNKTDIQVKEKRKRESTKLYLL